MKIGVIGGGQLGACWPWRVPLGMNFAFLDPAPDACAAPLGEHLRPITAIRSTCASWLTKLTW